MKRFIMSLAGIAFLTVFFVRLAFPHCEIPCGIYDDKTRITLMQEHIMTMEKSIAEIDELSKKQEKNYNQLVRWVNNKEVHADKLQEIVAKYFMTQRVKPVDKKDTKEYKEYVQQITLLHQMLVVAMKVKQTTDTAHTDELKSLVIDFQKLYFEEHDD